MDHNTKQGPGLSSQINFENLDTIIVSILAIFQFLVDIKASSRWCKKLAFFLHAYFLVIKLL